MESRQVHLSVKIISRGKGQCAVASAAYRSGSKIYCEYYGQTMDFSRKADIQNQTASRKICITEKIKKY